MKIKIKRDVPVGIEHGIRKGRIFEAILIKKNFWVMGDRGEKVLLHNHEYEEVENTDGIQA